MYIAYQNENIDSSISLDDDSAIAEVDITVKGSGSEEGSHIFQSLTQFDEFIDSAIFMRNRMAKKIGGSVRNTTY